MENETRSSKKPYAASVGFLLAGAIVGAALGVLFAPKAGVDTREDVGSWLKAKTQRRRIQLRAMKETLAARREALRARAKELIGA
ncbi:MAG: YtxH domain-containing protein [Elusimicrobiota bacterium]|nr:YtxH domain-containing protein [Elusimicrobiota bacterium]